MVKSKLLNIELPVINDTVGEYDLKLKEFVPCIRKPKIIERDDEIVLIAEDIGGLHFADYYGELHEYSWINPLLDEWAVENFGKDAFWEWENPSVLVLNID